MPDFFIIGAPKCGTSSLFQYLGNNPSIFLPANKEPHFYANDMYCRDTGLKRRVTDRTDYELMFDAATRNQLAGEGSTWYLYSREAVPAILHDYPKARFIVMLRNPVDMALSLHSHHVRKLYDDVEIFSKAWSLNSARAKGDSVPMYCPDEKMLDYRETCRFAPMLARLLDLVPRNQIHFIIFEEFISNTRQSYLETLSFLGIRDDGQTNFETSNPNRRLHSAWLYELLTYKPFPMNIAYPHLKRVANALGFRPGRTVFERNIKIEPRKETDMATMKCLAEAFAPDVPEVEAALGRNLDVWRNRMNALRQKS